MSPRAEARGSDKTGCRDNLALDPQSAFQILVAFCNASQKRPNASAMRREPPHSTPTLASMEGLLYVE